MMNHSQQYTGECFCSAVGFSLHGAPELMVYCHCDSCRHWSAGPINAATLWQPDRFTITRGAELLNVFDRIAATENREGPSHRQWCTRCGGHVFINHPAMGLVDIPAVLIKNFNFEPAFHVHYQQTVHPMRDGLPKFRDLPQAAGGSGEELPE